MVVPKYIETHWRGEGKAVLWFHHNPKQDEGETKYPTTAGKITCYLSSLNIKEYAERDQAISEEGNATSVMDTEMKKCPPDVLPEVWHSWLIHWEAWKDIYLPLAWVHKYRDICTSSYINWHDSYLEEYPEMLPIIAEGLNDPKESGSSEAPEELHKDTCRNTDGTNSPPEHEEKRGTGTYDKLYEEFKESRYWIHLRCFLQSSGVQATESLKQFFKESAHIDFKIVENESTCTADSGDILGLSEDSVENGDLNADDDQIVKNPISVIGASFSCKNVISTSDEQNTFVPSSICKSGKKREQDGMCDSDSRNEVNAVVLSENLGDKLNNLADVSKHLDDSNANFSPAENDFIEAVKEFDDSFSEKDQNHCTNYLNENKENLNAGASSFASKSKKKSPKRKRNDDNRLLNSGVAQTLKRFQIGLSMNDSSEKYPTFSESVSCRPTEDVSEGNMDCSNDSSSCNMKYQTEGELETRDRFATSATCLSVQETDSSPVGNVNKDHDASSSESVSSANETDEEYDDIEIHTGELILDTPEEEKAQVCNINLVDAEKTSKENVSAKGNSAKENHSIDTSKDTNIHRFFSHALNLARTSLVSCALYMLEVISPILNIPVSLVSHVFGFQKPVKCSANSKIVKDAIHKKLQKWLRQQTDSILLPLANVSLKNFRAYPEEREIQTVYQSVEAAPDTIDGSPYLIINTLDLQNMDEGEQLSNEYCDSKNDWKTSHIYFDEDGNPLSLSEKEARDLGSSEKDQSIWKDMISNCKLVNYKLCNETPPEDIPRHLYKYWAQRHRLFLRYDEGIILDEESWYSVTPEMIAAHQAYRCKCDVVVDAFCGSGGNAIQLAITCQQVIAIDIDANKIELARHNARVYGVEDRIKFIVGDFLKLAPTLKADVVFLSPPWGGTEYMHERIYNVKNLDGVLNCEELMRAARLITNNIALYLPRSSNLCHVIELAGLNGSVDIEYNNMSKKRKAVTAYYGDLVYY